MQWPRIHSKLRHRVASALLLAFMLGSVPAIAECEPPERSNQYPEPQAMAAAWDADNPAAAYRAGKSALDRCTVTAARPEECLDLMLAVTNAADAAGMHVEAEAVALQVLQVSTAVYGEESLQVALAASNLGVSLSQQSRFEPARYYFHVALDIRRRICGEQDLATARSYRNLAGVVRDLGYMTDAFRYGDAALKIQLALAGSSAPSTADAYRSLALTLGEMGEPAKALDLARKALSIHLSAKPRDVFDIASGYNDVAIYLLHLGRTDEAVANAEKSLETLRPVLDDDHPEMMSKMANLAAPYLTLGRTVEAEALLDKVIAAHRRHPGVALESVTTALAAKAGLLTRGGRPGEALPLRREIVDLLSGAHGDESPRLLHYREALANAELKGGDPAMALVQFRILADEADKDMMWAARRGIGDDRAIDYRDVYAGQVRAAWAAAHLR